MNIFTNYDVIYELNNHTDNFKFYNNFRNYSRIDYVENLIDLKLFLDKLNKIRRKIVSVNFDRFFVLKRA